MSNDDREQVKRQQRIISMRKRLKDVPPETQLARLFSALFSDAEDDCDAMRAVIVELRNALRPFIAAADPDHKPITRRDFDEATRVYAASRRWTE